MQMERTMDVQGAAAFLHACSDTVYNLARRGTIPATKVGRGWVFLESDLVNFLRAKQNEQRQKAQVSDSTKNRYIAFASTLFRLAANEWEWIPKAPVFQKRKEASRRIRWLKKSEAARLLSELAPHLKPVVQFALATGFRHSNIIGLEWSQVNLVKKMAWIHPDQAKAGEAIGMPLNATAMEVLIGQVGKHPKWVFTYRGEKIKQKAATGFKNALKRAGIDNFRFHDLRHTWASWLVQSGVPLHVIQELGGWHSFEMVKRYAHLAPEHLREHVESIDSLIDSGTNLSQVSLTDAEQQERKKALLAATP